MRLDYTLNSIRIVPEDTLFDKRDSAFIESILGLKYDGDVIELVRRNCHGLSSIAYLTTQNTIKKCKEPKPTIAELEKILDGEDVDRISPTICECCGRTIR